jgi:ankyrin repeat protein
VCRLLVASGPDTTLTCEIHNRAGGCTLLDHAASNGHVDVDVCSYLVELGADVNAKNVNLNHLDLLQCLVSAGADVSACCCPGATPLSLAACAGELRMCCCLLGVGADVNAEGVNMQALHWAAQEQCVDVYVLFVAAQRHHGITHPASLCSS